MLIRPKFDPAPNVKVMLNIGACLDIPTGYYIKGLHGESILNGGLGVLTGITAIANNFKSSLMHYMMLSAADRIASTASTHMSTYDTEINIHESTLRTFANEFESFANRDILNSGEWVITDKTVYLANKWYEILKDYLREKRDNAKQLMVDTPFPDRTGQNPLRIITPTFGELDSFSEFETEDVTKLMNDNELGDAGGQIIHMRQGLSKMRFLMEIPALVNSAYHYMLLTAQLGKDNTITTGPIPQPPVKKLQYLKHGDKLKGVTDKFTFLMSNCWHAFNAVPLINSKTKEPEYPKSPDESTPGDLDLNIVSLRQLRSKSGPTGITLDIIVSQSTGVQPSLTEFHYIKEMGRFGLTGNLQKYHLDLYPNSTLSRPTIRSKINTDSRLRRALNITSELCQMHQHWRYLDPDLLCTPKQLYDDLTAMGYKMDELLETRGWWTVNNDKHPVPYLSTMDMLRMRKKEYTPYWYKKK